MEPTNASWAPLAGITATYTRTVNGTVEVARKLPSGAMLTLSARRAKEVLAAAGVWNCCPTGGGLPTEQAVRITAGQFNGGQLFARPAWRGTFR